MDLIIVISLLVIGWIFIYIDIFFIPGVTVFAILGIGMMITGFYFSFTTLGNNCGWASVGISMVVMGVSLYAGFKSGLWNKLSLKQSLEDSRMNTWEEGSINAGDTGVAVSRIAPSGTARFGEKDFEVHSQSEFINPKTAIEVVRIENKKIIVQTKK